MLPISSTIAETGELAEVIQSQKITKKQKISIKPKILRKVLSQKKESKRIPQDQTFLTGVDHCEQFVGKVPVCM